MLDGTLPEKKQKIMVLSEIDPEEHLYKGERTFTDGTDAMPNSENNR